MITPVMAAAAPARDLRKLDVCAAFPGTEVARVAGGPLIRPPHEAVQRHDDEWAPEPLWYGRLKGRETSLSLFLDATPIPQASAPDSSVMGGLGALGSRFMWDRDPWGSRLPTAIGGSVEIGLRGTSQDTSYLIVAERTNTNGSKKFRTLLEAGDFDGMVSMARDEMRDGSHVLDVCVDFVGRDGVRDGRPRDQGRGPAAGAPRRTRRRRSRPGRPAGRR